MPFVVECSCGKKFMAQDELEGKQVPCPSCRESLRIVQPQAPPPTPAKPASRPASLPQPSSQQPSPRPKRTNAESNWATQGSYYGQSVQQKKRPVADQTTLIIAVVMGATVVLCVLMIGGAMVFVSSQRRLADTGSEQVPPTSQEPVGQRPDPQQVDARPPSEAPVIDRDVPAAPTSPVTEADVPPPTAMSDARLATKRQPSNLTANSLEVDLAARETATASGRNSAAGSGGKRVESAIKKWYSANGKLAGLRRVPQEQMEFYQYSWHTALLPFLGHQEIYEKIDFDKSWARGKNVSVAATVIPQFLNPRDERKRWKGYPFDKLALTHFVGMSGLETRNTVAARLPRDDPRAGIFGYDEVARKDQITDGTAHTIMMLGSGELTAPWIAGGGGTVRGARQPFFDPTTGFGSRGSVDRGTMVLMADGSTRFLPADIDPEVFAALCTTHGGESVDLANAGEKQGRFPTRTGKPAALTQKKSGRNSSKKKRGGR